jgi:hypothetical protein
MMKVLEDAIEKVLKLPEEPMSRRYWNRSLPPVAIRSAYRRSTAPLSLKASNTPNAAGS